MNPSTVVRLTPQSLATELMDNIQKSWRLLNLVDHKQMLVRMGSHNVR